MVKASEIKWPMSHARDQSQKENRKSSISKSLHEDKTSNNPYFFSSLLGEILSSQPLKTFAAHRYSDRSAAIHAIAALGRLSDDRSRFKLEIIPLGKNTHVEIRIPQFNLRCFIVQAALHEDSRLHDE